MTDAARKPLGRPPRLTPELVVATAIELVRADGLAALTMRSLASHLDATPMALYRHVGDREELARRVVDELFARMPLPDDSLPVVVWLRALAHEIRTLGRTHHGVMDVLLDEGPVVRSTLVILDRTVQKLHREGLGWKAAAAVHNTFFSWLAATIRREERWATRAAPLARFLEVAGEMPKKEFPGLARVLAEMPGDDVDLEFERSLGFMIDAIRAKLVRKR